MGSPTGEEGHEDDEFQHSVTITRAYCMKATEVTQGEWQAVMGSNPSEFKSCGANCPVEQVNWDDAVGYANALSRREGLPECYAGSTFTGYAGSTFTGITCTGYRLPTEAEWEYAARAGTTAATYGKLDSVAWVSTVSAISRAYVKAPSTTHPVRQKLPNAWGLYDMLGNVWEWTGDWYDTYPATVTDPLGAGAGSIRVNRGGSWIPFAGGAPDPAVADRFLETIQTAGNQPAFIHCASGNRAAAMWLIKRVLIDKWELDKATEEAAQLGLTSAPLKKFALDYVEAHKK